MRPIRDVAVEIYHPPPVYKTYEEGLLVPAALTAASGDKAAAFVSSQLNVDSSQLARKSGYTADNSEFVYLHQLHEGIPFVNAVANVAFKGGKVVAFGQSFVDTSKIAPSKPTIDVSTAISKAEQSLSGTYTGQPTTLEYLARDDGSVALVHAIQVRNVNIEAGHVSSYEAYIDAHTGELISVTDWVSNASYKVLPIQKKTIDEGLETLVDPVILAASPLGWHNNGTANTTSTSGNNGQAMKTSDSIPPIIPADFVPTQQSADGLQFIYTYDPSLDPTDGENLDAARTNAFYLLNMYHDTLYLYGFTESAFNFQINNFGKGGAENDPIFISVQDRGGVNNAAFVASPDGQPAVIFMFIWDHTNPNRDGVMENDIPVHELTHGLTSRMTGGGTGRCLQNGQAAGLAEGWSDAVADWFKHTSGPEVDDFVAGTWVTGTPAGTRSHPYSTNNATNPYTFSSIAGGIPQPPEIHGVGEVWANMLHNVYAALVDAHGWSATARTDSSGLEGNVVFLHLLVDALALQPCNPNFIHARDAWIQADANRYGGANKCILWRAFASRGLGVDAKSTLVDGFQVPAGC